MDIITPGDYSLSDITASKRGMPYRGLELLYMLDDAGQTEGTNWAGTTALDTSGNGRNGTFQASSSKVRQVSTLEGVRTASGGTSNGLAIVSPLAISGPFTGIVTVRNQLGNGPSQGYQAYYRSSVQLATISGAQLVTPGFSVSEDLQTGSGETTPRKLRFLCDNADETLEVSVIKQAAALTFGLSVDPDTDTILLRAAGVSLEIVDAAAVADVYEGSSPTHVFGIMKLTTSTVFGTLGMGTVYSYAMNEAQIDIAIAAQKAIKGGS